MNLHFRSRRRLSPFKMNCQTECNTQRDFNSNKSCFSPSVALNRIIHLQARRRPPQTAAGAVLSRTERATAVRAVSLYGRTGTRRPQILRAAGAVCPVSCSFRKTPARNCGASERSVIFYTGPRRTAPARCRGRRASSPSGGRPRSCRRIPAPVSARA